MSDHDLAGLLHGLNTLNERLAAMPVASNSQASINAGSITNGLALGFAVGSFAFVILAIIGAMLAFQSLRAEVVADQKAALEREQAWQSVWNSRVESAIAKLRAEKEQKP